MRISDWSSDVCSSDLRIRSSGAHTARSGARCSCSSATSSTDPTVPDHGTRARRKPGSIFSGTGRFAGTPASTWPGSSASPGDWINSTRSLRFLRHGAGEKNAMPKLHTLVLAGGLVLACPALAEPPPPIEDFVRHPTYSGTSISPTSDYLAIPVDLGDQYVLTRSKEHIEGKECVSTCR